MGVIEWASSIFFNGVIGWQRCWKWRVLTALHSRHLHKWECPRVSVLTIYLSVHIIDSSVRTSTYLCTRLTSLCTLLTALWEQFTYLCTWLTSLCTLLTALYEQFTYLCIRITSLCTLTSLCEQFTYLCTRLTSLCQLLINYWLWVTYWKKKNGESLSGCHRCFLMESLGGSGTENGGS